MKEKQEQAANEDRRRDYEKPAVSSEEVFETLALTCAKAVGQQSCGPTGGEPAARS